MHENTVTPDPLQVAQRFAAMQRLQEQRIDEAERRLAAITATQQQPEAGSR
jgi:hypothetical protein